MSSLPAANPNMIQVPPPQSTPAAIVQVLMLLQRNSNSLGGFAGPASSRAVTLQDLVTLGLVTQAQINALLAV